MSKIDNTAIYQRKERGRRALAALSINEKLAKLDKLKERGEEMRAARRVQATGKMGQRASR